MRTLVQKSVFRLALAEALLAGLLFGAAGGLDWPMAWVVLVALAGCLCLNLTVLMRANPDVIAVRLEGLKGAERWDRAVLSILLAAVLLALLAAGLDRRLDWSEPIPGWLQLAGLPVLALGDLLSLWAMKVNRFYAAGVRIQKARDHRVVSAGPYRHVRHPGYVGWFLLWTGMMLMLGSWPALALSLLANIAIVYRTAREDRMLRDGLKGYSAYAERVRYRLVPGVW